jgi:8-oxo-dGTP pyrophosphatase MutT (NUDIX family)
MLVRPGAAGVEVFTFRRIPRLAFAAGMLVFPGGAVDPRDADPAVPWAGPPPSEFVAALSADENLARAVVVAAVRETFEECGVLLAGPAGGDPLARTLVGEDDWDAHRNDLVEGSVGLAEVLRRHGLVLRADLLRPWAHWITPVGEPRRFDTRFFAAALPAGQQAHDLGGEGERAAWLPPAEALARHAAGDLPMLPPTVVTLEELAAVTSVGQLLATRRVPRPVSPWVARAGTGEDGNERFVLRIDLDGLGGGEAWDEGAVG